MRHLNKLSNVEIKNTKTFCFGIKNKYNPGDKVKDVKLMYKKNSLDRNYLRKSYFLPSNQYLIPKIQIMKKWVQFTFDIT